MIQLDWRPIGVNQYLPDEELWHLDPKAIATYFYLLLRTWNASESRDRITVRSLAVLGAELGMDPPTTDLIVTRLCRKSFLKVYTKQNGSITISLPKEGAGAKRRKSQRARQKRHRSKL